MFVPLVPGLSAFQEQVSGEFIASTATVNAMSSSHSALVGQWVSNEVAFTANFVAVGQIGWAFADLVVGPVISVRFAASCKTVAGVAVEVVPPGLAGAAVNNRIALANWVGGPFVIGAASGGWVAFAKLVQRVDVIGAAFLCAIANTEWVRLPGVTFMWAALGALVALAVRVGQVGLILAALLRGVALAVGVGVPSVGAKARSAELGSVVNAWAAFLFGIALRAP